ncbi:MAG: hypothetical protein LBP83_06915 [Dysgonamonadaceae bacterium]|jgi:hypothetical protein|nr:hypothetical protein [Dysgonamonadaceae bacterium]
MKHSCISHTQAQENGYSFTHQLVNLSFVTCLRMKTIPAISNNRLRPAFILLFLFCTYTMQATPTLTLTATNGTCVSDCKITANVTNAVAPVTYSLINYPTAGQNTAPQESNVFSDLLPGTYTVGVYDATTAGIPITKTITVTTSYVPISANAPTTGYTSGVNCAPNGTMNITFTGGKSPFRVKITNQNAPYNFQEKTITSTVSSKTASFTDLVTGNYVFEIEDACGQWQQNIPGTSVAVNGDNYQLSNISFTALACPRSNVNSYIYGTVGNCTTLNMYYYYTDLDITTYDQTTSTTTSTTFNPSSYYSSIQFRVEYPAGSGIYNTNGWLSGWSMPLFTLSNYDRTQANGDRYVVEVKHPCTGAITRSPEYTLPPESSFFISSNTYTRTDFCTYNPSVTVSLRSSGTTEIRTFNCNNPYTFTVKQGANVIDTKSTTGTTSSVTFTGSDGLQMGTAYTVEVTGTGGFTQTLNFTTTTDQPVLSSLTTYRLHDYSTTSSSYVTGYNYHFCDYNTTGIYAYFTAVSGQSVTYSIAATGTTPAITRTPITLASSGRLWTDLPWGTYNVTADYGCGTYTTPVTLTKTVSGFAAEQPTYTDYPTVCGKYSLSGRAYFHLNGTRISSTNYQYRYYMLIVDGPEKIGTRTYQYGSTSYQATINDLPGGTYKVVFYPYFTPVSTQTINGKSVTYYPTDHSCLIEETIVIPEYIRPLIDVPFSGGISCTNGSTNMTINVTSSSNRGPFSYRYKVAGAADNTYTPAGFQTSNVFPGITPGDYTVQVKDQCGSITTQNVHVFNGDEQFVGIVGEIQPGVICEGREVTLSVLSIGPVQWYKWYYSSTGTAGSWSQLSSTAPTYVITSATQAHKGYYKVEIYNGLCQLESQVHIIDVLPPAPTPSISGSNLICTSGSTVLTAQYASTINSPSFRWYRNGSMISGANSPTYTATSAGTYSVDVTPSLACPSDQSNAHVITEVILNQPVISPSSATICNGTSTTFTATPNLASTTYTWYRGGSLVTSAASNTYSATVAGTYTVTISQSGCTSVASAGAVLTVNPSVTPMVVISAGTTGFEVCEDAVTQIALTATPTNGGTPSYVWKVNGASVGTGSTYTLTDLAQYRPKATVSCEMTSTAFCAVPATVTDEKNIRISSCVIPVNPHIRGGIAN